MPHFTLPLESLATPAVNGTFGALIGMEFADTLGHEGKLTSLHIGCGVQQTPADVQISVRGAIYDNTTDGTSTDAIASICKVDAGSVASVLAAVGKQYTVLPTAANRIFLSDAFNQRGGFHREWHEERKLPKWGQNETLVILAAIGSGDALALVNVTVGWKE